MLSLTGIIEALLFVSGHPLSDQTIARYAQAEVLNVRQTLEELQLQWKQQERGIQLLKNGSHWQLVSHSDAAPSVFAFAKEEVLGELTRAQLETLAVVAYRGPIEKGVLDTIRGVNCRQILRNLATRGLVEAVGARAGHDDEESGSDVYEVSADFIRHLGLTRLEDLPQFEEFRSAAVVDDVVAAAS